MLTLPTSLFQLSNVRGSSWAPSTHHLDRKRVSHRHFVWRTRPLYLCYSGRHSPQCCTVLLLLQCQACSTAATGRNPDLPPDTLIVAQHDRQIIQLVSPASTSMLISQRWSLLQMSNPQSSSRTRMHPVALPSKGNDSLGRGNLRGNVAVPLQLRVNLLCWGTIVAENSAKHRY